MGLYLGHTGPYKIGKKYKLYIGRKNQGHVHNFVLEQTVNATCTTEGYLLYRCSCNVTSKNIIPALGHTSSGYAKNAEEHWIECAVCHEELSERAVHIPFEDDDCTTDILCTVCGAVVAEGAESHTGGTATCTTLAKCEVCGKEYGKLNPESHLDSNLVYLKSGSGHITYCGDCQTQLTSVEDHTYDENGVCVCGAVQDGVCLEHDLYTPEGKFKGNAPTCNFEGSTPYYECRNCDYVQLPQSLPADPDAHNFIDGVCTNCYYVCEHSTITDCYCSDCGAPFHEWATADECVCNNCGEINHDWVTSDEEIPATCITDGRKAITYCGKCGTYHPESGEIIPCRGYHVEDENDSGVCIDCGEEFEGDMNDV